MPKLHNTCKFLEPRKLLVLNLQETLLILLRKKKINDTPKFKMLLNLKILKLPVSGNRRVGFSAQPVIAENNNKCWINYFKINSL